MRVDTAHMRHAARLGLAVGLGLGVTACAEVHADTAVRADRGSAPDRWDGPFDSAVDMIGSDAASWVAPVDDASLALPHGIAADTLSIAKRVEPTGDQPRFWHLALHTQAGWFMSPILGRGENRDTCDLLADGAVGDRLTIRYTCSVGRFDWAEKQIALLCAIDDAGRPACGSAVVSARFNVHTGGKDDGTDVIHDTLSCAATFTADAIHLAPTPVAKDAGDTAGHVVALGACHSSPVFALSGPFSAAAHATPPLFDAVGAPR